MATHFRLVPVTLLASALALSACSGTAELGNNRGDAGAEGGGDPGAVEAGAEGAANQVDEGGSGASDASDALAPQDGYTQKCTIACQVPSYAPCATQNPNQCVSSCVTQAKTPGISVACAQCVVAAFGWTGSYCKDSSTKCSFSTSGNGICEGSAGSTCTSADESCTLVVATPGDGACRKICL
jgi:hypothetical protein